MLGNLLSDPHLHGTFGGHYVPGREDIHDVLIYYNPAACNDPKKSTAMGEIRSTMDTGKSTDTQRDACCWRPRRGHGCEDSGQRSLYVAGPTREDLGRDASADFILVYSCNDILLQHTTSQPANTKALTAVDHGRRQHWRRTRVKKRRGCGLYHLLLADATRTAVQVAAAAATAIPGPHKRICQNLMM